jgi:hypothetical protein
MIALLKRLTQMMAAETLDARRVAEQTGTIESGGEPNVPYKVHPADKSVREIRVVHDAKTGEPSQVVLIPSAPLPMSQLTAAFGDYSRLPSLPNPKEPPHVSFDIEAPDAAYSISLIASYEGDDPALGQVVKVVILRD